MFGTVFEQPPTAVRQFHDCRPLNGRMRRYQPVYFLRNLKSGDDFEVDLAEGFPWALPSRDLIHMVWDGMLNSSVESFSALRLDRQTWLYFQYTDSEEDYLYFLAAAETNSASDAHKQFVTELFRSNGKTFGAEFLCSPPTEVASTFSKSFLADCFVSAADIAVKREYTTSADFWQQVQDDITRCKPNSLASSKVNLKTRAGKVQLMECYLAVVMKRR